MSVGYRADGYRGQELADTSVCELYAALGEGDTPALFDKPYTLNTEHDWPAVGGMSLDHKTIYIDRTIYHEIMDGEFTKATGLDPQWLLAAWIRHERVENAIIMGTNPVDTYAPAHNRALAAEHEVYRIAGVSPAKVEKAMWPAIERCYNRDPRNPPKDAWCGVYLDHATERDEEILAQLVRMGVKDAAKHSKYDVRYGMSGQRCDACSMWDPGTLSQERGQIAACTLVAGLVRANRGCEMWQPARNA